MFRLVPVTHQYNKYSLDVNNGIHKNKHCGRE